MPGKPAGTLDLDPVVEDLDRAVIAAPGRVVDPRPPRTRQPSLGIHPIEGRKTEKAAHSPLGCQTVLISVKDEMK